MWERHRLGLPQGPGAKAGQPSRVAIRSEAAPMWLVCPGSGALLAFPVWLSLLVSVGFCSLKTKSNTWWWIFSKYHLINKVGTKTTQTLLSWAAQVTASISRFFPPIFQNTSAVTVHVFFKTVTVHVIFQNASAVTAHIFCSVHFSAYILLY